MKRIITAIPGDGIGPELIEQTLLVLDEIGRKYHHEFVIKKAPAGGQALDTLGIPLPDDTLTTCQQSDAVILGAVGGPKWDNLDADLRPEQALLGLRRELGLYANIRPAVLHPALAHACPLRPGIAAQGIDICIVRELTGGIYFGDQGTKKGRMGPAAYDTAIYSEGEVERITRIAFKIAGKRGKKVTSVDKANILKSSMLWRSVVSKTAQDYPEIELEHMLVDNAAMQLIRSPQQFDVLLTTNMFGDILSDEASMLTGSIGMLPSASLGDEKFGLYEPVHGSAPDIAGLDQANPLATILSAAMMLRLSFNREKEACAVEDAVTRVLAQKFRTPDIMSPGMKLVGTIAMGELIQEALE